MYVLERQWKRCREEDELAVTSLPPKKWGRVLILVKTDIAVQEYILKLRERAILSTRKLSKQQQKDLFKH